MSEASRMTVKVNVAGASTGRPSVSRMVTLDSIKDWIRLQGFDDYTTNGLIDLAGRYPNAALPSFRKNINLMIQRVRAKRREEQGEDQDVQVLQQEAAAKSPTYASIDDAFSAVTFGADSDADPDPVEEGVQVGPEVGPAEQAERLLPRRRISLNELAEEGEEGPAGYDPEA